MMTYLELRNMLNNFDDDRLNCNVTILMPDNEFYPIQDLVSDLDTEGILCEDHPVLILDESQYPNKLNRIDL